MKDKIAKWQAVNGTGDWTDSLTEICDTINNQTHKSLPVDVTPMQLMFLRKPESFTSHTIFTTKEERQVLRQIFVEDIDSFCEEAEHEKGKERKLESHSQVEDALEIIPNEEGYKKEDSDTRNPLQFRYIRCPCLLLFMYIYQLLLRNPLQNASKLPRQSSSDASSSFSSDSLSSSQDTRTARQKGISPARSPTSKSASISPYEYLFPTTFAAV